MTRNGFGKIILKLTKSKKIENRSQIAVQERKTTIANNFCTIIIAVKEHYAAKPGTSLLHLVFRRCQNHHPNSTSKIINMSHHFLENNCSPFGRNKLYSTKKVFTHENTDLRQKEVKNEGTNTTQSKSKE